MVSVTPTDLTLVTQPIQKRHLMIQVLNRDFNRMFNIEGDVISCSINVDESSDIKTTASLSMKVSQATIANVIDLNLNNYLRIYIGIENNLTGYVTWYLQGVFIINSQGLNFSLSERTLSLDLSDRMTDFTATRRGKLHGYNAIIENSQRFDDVMKNLVCDLGGCEQYNITPIHPTRTQSPVFDTTRDKDYLIPMKLEASVGVTIYDLLSQLVNVYSNWEMFFSPDGTFICQAKLGVADDSAVLLDDKAISKLKISDTPAFFDVSKIKNVIEVWGKDGLYYGEARDENPDSPFSVSAIGELREVMSGGNYDNIYDRYKDVERNQTLQAQVAEIETQIAELDVSTAEGQAEERRLNHNLDVVQNQITANIKYKGNDMAKEWAEYLLDSHTRLNSTSTLTLISCPFLNQTGFKIAYRNEAYQKPLTYIVTAVSQDYSANTTTLTLARFYDDNTESNLLRLDTPIVASCSMNGYVLDVEVEPVTNATEYSVYLNGRLLMTDTTTSLVYTLDETQSGTFSVTVTASADNYAESAKSTPVIVTVGNTLVTNDGEEILTNSGNAIIYEDGE